jgi:DNA-binding CsgD family transcriptional regulator
MRKLGLIPAFCPLTGREQQVLMMVGSGRTTKEIASTLGTSVETIANHRKHICQKLDVHSTAQMVSVAARSIRMEYEDGNCRSEAQDAEHGLKPS